MTLKIKMDTRAFFKSFWQIISIFKIFALQTLSLFFLSYSYGLLADATGARGCPPKPESFGVLFFSTLAGSIVVGILSLHPIVFPRIWLEEISKEFSRSQLGFRFPFFSTHPSYVLLDALLFVPALLFFWNGQNESLCEFNVEWGQGLAAVIIAITFPTIRLIFWFILGRQIYAMRVKNVWMGIIWWYLLTIPLIIFFSYTYIKGNILPRREVPVVESGSFTGGIDTHPEFLNRIIRVRGIIKQGMAKCGLWGKKDRTDFPYGTVVLDMGEGNGEIIVQAKKPSQVLNLEAEVRRGGAFETFGRLSKLPNPEKKMICAISKLPDDPPPGGRALLEIEFPK